MILWLLVACGPERDPALDRYTTALGAYDDGKKALDGGDAATAAVAFARALAADPDSTALPLWLSYAQAHAGATTEAIRTLDTLLAVHPGASVAFYNRAAYRARVGDLGGAAADLRIALAAGVASPYAATMDPDFASHRTDPAFTRVLPPAPIAAVAEGPAGDVFLGSTVEVKLTLTGIPDPAPALHIDTAGSASCLALQALIEDDSVADLDLRRVVTLRYAATAPCAGTVGPFTVTLPKAAPIVAAAVPVRVDAPPGALTHTPPPTPTDLPLPASFILDPATHLATLQVAPGVLVLAPPDIPLGQDGRPPEVRMEWRVNGQTRTTGGWWRDAAPVDLGGGGTAEGLSAPPLH